MVSSKYESAVEGMVLQRPEALVDYFSAEARRYARAGYSKATLKAYGSHWKGFHTWCKANDQCPLPASIDTLRHYLVHLAQTPALNSKQVHKDVGTRRVTSLRHALSAIRFTHHLKGVASLTQHPDVLMVLRGIRMVHGLPVEPAEAILVGDLLNLVAALPPPYEAVQSVRDRAMLCLGFAAALRISELSTLRWWHLKITSVGLLVTVYGGKGRAPDTFQTVMAPAAVRHPLICPVQSVEKWREVLHASGRAGDGDLVFPRMKGDRVYGSMRNNEVSSVLQRAAELAGIRGKFTAHSLRNGWATSASAAGCSLILMMQHLRHSDPATTARYIQPMPWEVHPASKMY